MNGENSQNINSAAAQASQSEAAFAVPLKTGYRTYENYLLRARTIYDRAVTDFFKLSGDDPRLLDAAERWRTASVSLMRWACSFYRKIDATPEQRELALKLMDSVTKDSATRCDNVSQYYDLLAAKDPANTEALLKAEKADLLHLDVLSRMIETQSKYIRMQTESPEHESVELRLEREASKESREYFPHIPGKRSYRPAFPYPPERIPEDEPVPDLPDPISRVDDVPVEYKYYDEELDTSAA